MKDIIFIPKQIILHFHKQLIQLYGGSTGIRDEELLDSALEQPKATFDESYLHNSIFKMASAYGFHLCKNHPFIDGNKRIALVAMDTFLQKNGYEITASEKETYKIIIALSSGEISKEELTKWLKQNTNSI
ncbi:type II toxin-antitoxin system death-on-curing family toxin [Natroniella sulfidigena]|uniref:type II toxin-antitoxin system death-on-curing family toxin n=1 Tax=Natroniella sulfidigena TaxID=723921 RepID=UPI00200B4442|nr:type II toxin-antitoxin system death-on-curing family toxin [Natroniella sulfidigena]MCK8816738.1 type II toxin-antitoxin system death-on-curing family toxin [Natroniella sulfidigena]